ncbi:30S ribosomal protein S7 [Patescibacteria group bacterium]|nr:30S ribosomal protein S7 [Patescibacteria group bacterium]MBU1015886.1 30S ribosomal protein S7 [Patescibacteria group bacterium]MBU1685055.1 30S ribosomal protein S7 [Patescibacteria group bacterium]MBU1938182.1 30S ribosomal protein S7 [Patescibacteria group bacterium]
MSKVKYIPEGSTQWQEKFINCMMLRGKKSISRNIFGNAMKIIRDQGVKNPEEVFEKAIRNVMPNMEVRAKRVGGSVYQIPVEVKPKRQLALAMRWIIGACRSKKGKSMSEKLAVEFLEAGKESGTAFKKREDVHRMAAANKAFAHLARYSRG